MVGSVIESGVGVLAGPGVITARKAAADAVRSVCALWGGRWDVGAVAESVATAVGRLPVGELDFVHVHLRVPPDASGDVLEVTLRRPGGEVAMVLRFTGRRAG